MYLYARTGVDVVHVTLNSGLIAVKLICIYITASDMNDRIDDISPK